MIRPTSKSSTRTALTSHGHTWAPYIWPRGLTPWLPSALSPQANIKVVYSDVPYAQTPAGVSRLIQQQTEAETRAREERKEAKRLRRQQEALARDPGAAPAVAAGFGAAPRFTREPGAAAPAAAAGFGPPGGAAAGGSGRQPLAQQPWEWGEQRAEAGPAAEGRQEKRDLKEMAQAIGSTLRRALVQRARTREGAAAEPGAPVPKAPPPPPAAAEGGPPGPGGGGQQQLYAEGGPSDSSEDEGFAAGLAAAMKQVGRPPFAAWEE